MFSMKKWTSCKFLAVFLSVFFVMEAHTLAAQQNAAQEEQWAAQFKLAKEAYFGADFENAKTILEKLISDLGPVQGRDTFKGQVFLLTGATYEMLKFKELSIKFFCRAKAILGENNTSEGLELKKFKYYKENCAGAGVIAGAVAAPRKRSFLGGFLRTLLFLSVLGAAAYFIYTKYIKKGSDSGTDTTTFTSACFSTNWHFDIYSEWSGTVGTVSLTPDAAPQPNESNGWDNSVTYTLSTSGGGSLTLIRLKLSVTIGGGDNGVRRDLVYMDGAQILDQTNTFTQLCSAPGAKDYSEIYQRNSTGSFTLRHKVELSKAQAVFSGLSITKK
jgi:hypothetical protein